MRWILFVLTHILHAGILILPIQKSASLNPRRESNPWLRRIISLWLTVWVSRSEETRLFYFFFFFWEPPVNVSCRLFKGIVVISAASAVRLITQKELYVSRNNRIDWAHSPKGVGLQQSALFNRWYRSDGTLQCDLYHAALWEMGHHSKSHSLSGRAGRSPWLCSQLDHTVERHGRRHSACLAITWSTFMHYVQRHFHLKKNHLIHMWTYISAYTPPLRMIFL